MDRQTRRILVLLVVAGLIVVMDRRSDASTLVTFEDTNTAAEQPLYNGYAGLNWQNVETMNTNWWLQDGNPVNGYVNGAVSPPTVAWVPADGSSGIATATISSSTPFAFTSADFTAAWNDNLKLQITGYLDGQLVGSQTVTVNPSAPSLVNLNFAAVDTVQLNASGGTRDPAFPTAGLDPPPSPQFVIDNVTLGGGSGNTSPTGGSSSNSGPPLPVPAPEPSSLAAAAILTAGAWLWRKRSRCQTPTDWRKEF
jgi:hypothetical protein